MLLLGEKYKKIINNSFAKNSRALFSNSILHFIINMFVNMIIIRGIGEVNNGISSYILATVAIFQTVLEYGLESLCIRELSLEKYGREEVLGTAIRLRVILLIISSMLCLFFIWNKRHSGMYLVFTAVYLLSYVAQPLLVYKYYYISQMKSQRFVKYQNAVLIIFGILKLFFVFFRMELIWLFVFRGSEILCSGLVCYYVFHKDYNVKIIFSKALACEFLKEGFFLTLAGLSVVLYMKIDQIMVGDLLGESVLGVYSLAVYISELWYFVPTTIHTAVYPKMIELQEKEEKEIVEKLFLNYYRVMVDIAIIFGVLISIMVKIFIPVFFGSDYMDSIRYIYIYIWSGIFVGLGLARTSYLTYKKYNLFNAVATAFACLLNILLNYILVPRIGAIGAAVATLVSYSFSAVISSLFWEKTRHMGILQLKAIFIPIFVVKYCKRRFRNGE